MEDFFQVLKEGMPLEKKKAVKEYVLITAGLIIVAAAIYFFMIPANIVMGSITGLAMVLVHVVPVPISVMTLILNVVCLVLGYLLIGKEFGVKTIYVSVMLPVILNIFERAFPGQQSMTGDIVLDALAFIILISVGQVIMFNQNASSGGLDVIAKIMNKYFYLDLGQSVAIAGMVVVLTSVFFYDTVTLVVGALGTYFNGIVVDEYISGFSRKKKVSILSKKHEELKDYIMKDLKRGVTLYTAKGGYDGIERVELVTIVNKNEYALLMNHIRETDRDAFVTVATISEVVGMWNMKGRR